MYKIIEFSNLGQVPRCPKVFAMKQKCRPIIWQKNSATVTDRSLLALVEREVIKTNFFGHLLPHIQRDLVEQLLSSIYYPIIYWP